MDDAGERARQLRREGKTTTRKIAARERARELRADGWSYNAIAAELGVAKSSVSVWCRDIVLSEEQREALMLPVAEAQKKRGATARAMRIRRTELIQRAAAAEIGELSDRELFLVGVGLYWAEGSKQKPWSPSTRVKFINSDASVITVFLAWLRLIGVDDEDRSFAIAIHERADVDGARRYWSEIANVPMESLRVQLKRHNPKPGRHNVEGDYVGGLVVVVRRSTDLNRRIAGWWRAMAQRAPGYAG